MTFTGFNSLTYLTDTIVENLKDIFVMILRISPINIQLNDLENDTTLTTKIHVKLLTNSVDDVLEIINQIYFVNIFNDKLLEKELYSIHLENVNNVVTEDVGKLFNYLIFKRSGFFFVFPLWT
jgi:hypothetical protein